MTSLVPVHQENFDDFFTSNTRAITASMLAYVVAQLLDVRLFHFWKNLTQGRHLWLRNNGSTFGSQLVDTVLVTAILFWGTALPGQSGTYGLSEIAPLIRDGFIFKAIVALIDTPLLYLAVEGTRRTMRLPVPASNELKTAVTS
ncbi:MAG: queuosine precursor transporter [Deltaproteobacteria bacterium]|nr:queuosine precursor transporter [Deltaproteobacteria bacterium]